MPMYVLHWEEATVERRMAFVEADSESAARQCWIDGHFDDESVLVPIKTSHTLDLVEEITEHDELCCCPWCMKETDDNSDR